MVEAGSTSSTTEGQTAGELEIKLAEFEYAIWHLGSAFARWRRDCLAAVSDVSLSSTEASILHAVHMHGGPKGVMEISRLLHRDDHANIQYGLKKLAQLGLIEKKGNSRKNMTYLASAAGNEIVASYLVQRREVLMKLFSRVAPSTAELSDLIMQMHVMIGIYDQSSDLVMSRQP
jgi:predicted MarR family transcription regulator